MWSLRELHGGKYVEEYWQVRSHSDRVTIPARPAIALDHLDSPHGPASRAFYGVIRDGPVSRAQWRTPDATASSSLFENGGVPHEPKLFEHQSVEGELRRDLRAGGSPAPTFRCWDRSIT